MAFRQLDTYNLLRNSLERLYGGGDVDEGR